MKIVVITGSPRKTGTSALLTDEFIRGAEESGHEIFRFDAAFKDVHPCIGCEKCEQGKKKCVFEDDMQILIEELLIADIVVFVTPVYYHSYSAQIKAVIDRLHGFETLMPAGKKAILMATAAADVPYVADGLVTSHKITLRHLKWEHAGKLIALGCETREQIENSDYPRQAYEMGKSI